MSEGFELDLRRTQVSLLDRGAPHRWDASVSVCVISRVFATSRGVVIAAAQPPATEPRAMFSQRTRSRSAQHTQHTHAVVAVCCRTLTQTAVSTTA